MMSKSLELVVDQPDERAAKRERVADAALIVFQRYGFARTTMSDIAEAVGMSRPALYLLFPNKEEIFAAAVLSAMSSADFACTSPNSSASGECPLSRRSVMTCSRTA